MAKQKGSIMIISGIIYGLCAATAGLCAYLLLRGALQTKSRLLLWSGLCFIGLALNNILLIIDQLFIPQMDLSTVRLIPALLGMILLMYGLICETD
jgi:hypothetical protein